MYLHINDSHVLLQFVLKKKLHHPYLFTLVFQESVETPYLIPKALGSVKNSNLLLVCTSLKTDTFSVGETIVNNV